MSTYEPQTWTDNSVDPPAGPISAARLSHIELGIADASNKYFAETLSNTNLTLAPTDVGTRIVATAALTITLPDVGVLGDGFECQIVNKSGVDITVVPTLVDGVTMTDNQIANVLEVNGEQFVLVANPAPTTATVESRLLSEVTKSTTFTLSQDDSRKRFVVTASVTVTLPDVGILGNGFECEIVNDSGGTVTIDGVGATNATLNDGDYAVVMEANQKQRVAITATIETGDLFAPTAVWDPFVFGNNLDLTHWWDATLGVVLDATTGNITSWTEQIQPTTSSAAGTQTTAARQPTWVSGNEIRFEGTTKSLVVKTQSRAGFENRWYLMLFRVNWAAGTYTTDSYLFTMNGDTNVNGRQIPRVDFLHATKQLRTVWYSNDGSHSVVVTVPGSDDTWHSLVARRDENAIYASIDGAAEVSLNCYPSAYLDSGSSPTGWIGNGVTTSPSTLSWGLDSLVMGQGHLTATEIAKLHGWAMWRRGAEASLDSGSPYRLAAPLQSRSEVHTATVDSYADGYRFPSSGGWDDSLRGQAVSTAGMTRTFHDHFTSLSTVTDGLTGAGPWWAPAHINTSNAQFRRPGQTVNDIYTLYDATTLQLKMYKVGGTGPAYSGHIQSVDSWGNGFVQTVPGGGAVYYEARIALNNANGWPAFWLYSQSSMKDSAVSKAEIDILEAYGDNLTSQKQLHTTVHLHPAYRPQPGNIGGVGATGVTTSSPSKLTDTTASPFNSANPLFDGAGAPGTFHTYGCRIDHTWITFYFDGLLVSRFPVFKEALGPLFMLISLQSQDGSVPFQDTFMWIDYVDAYST